MKTLVVSLVLLLSFSEVKAQPFTLVSPDTFSFFNFYAKGDTLLGTTYSPAVGYQILQSFNGGNTWSKTARADSANTVGMSLLCVDPNNFRTLYATRQPTNGNLDGKAYRSINAGQSWQVFYTPTSGDVKKMWASRRSNQELFLVYDNNLVADYDILIRSTNGGVTWLDASGGLGIGQNGRAITLFLSDIDSVRAYARVDILPLYDHSYHYKSTNRGQTWQYLYDYTGTGGRLVNNMVSILKDGQWKLFIAGAKEVYGIFLADDWDSEWQLSLPSVAGIVAVPTLQQSAISVIGPRLIKLNITTNAGNSWQSLLQDSLPAQLTANTLIDTETGKLYFPTGQGLYRYDSPLSTSEPSSPKPSKLYLSQNYPNPFNPETTISYQLPTNSEVTLKVFDILGHELITLIDSKQAAGNYSVKFNSMKLSSGVYFYRLQSESFSQTKKMILVK